MLAFNPQSLRGGLSIFLVSLLLLSACKKKDLRSNLSGFTSFSIKDLPVTFQIDEVQGKIFNTDSLPYQTDVSSLISIFTTVPNATVKVGSTPQVSGVTVNNFSQPVTYTVVAENGNNTRQYAVTVNVAKLDPAAVAWQQVTTDAGWGNYHSLIGTAYNGKLWAHGSTIGSFNSFSFGSYSSTNGSSWTKLKAVDNNGDSIPRTEFGALLSFNNKLWRLGGHMPGSGFSFSNVTDKVWSSTDGENWTVSVPANAGDRWSKRERIGAVVFNNKMWVIGGNPYPPFGNTNSPGAPLKDIWSSADGTTWTQVNATPPFIARTNPAVFVFKNKIWIAGGMDASKKHLNDIWNSADGVTWTEVNTTTPFPVRFGHQIVANKDQLLMVGGENTTGVLNDLWVSSDEGVTWNQIQSGDIRALPANFPARTLFSMFVHDKNIWIIGGLGAKQNNAYTFRNDIWKGTLN